MVTSSDSGPGDEQSSVTAAVPEGTDADDVVIGFISRWGGNPTVTPADGFELLAEAPSDDGAATVGIWWKRTTSDEPDEYTFAWGDGLWSYLQLVRVPGATTSGVPITGTTGRGQYGACDPLSIDTEFVPAALVWHVYNDAGSTHTPPTGFTESSDVDLGATAYRDTGLTTGVNTASGGSVDDSTSSGAVILLAVIPASDEPDPPVEGAVELSADTDLDAVATAVAFGEAELDAPTGLAALGLTEALGTAPLSAASGLGASAVTTAFGALELSGESGVSAAAVVEAHGSTGLSGSSTLDATGRASAFGGLDLSAASDLSVGVVADRDITFTAQLDPLVEHAFTAGPISAAALSADITGPEVAAAVWF